MFENKIKWELIYKKEQIDNSYHGYVQETWECKVRGSIIVRHVYYKLDNGDESERTETMVRVL